MKKLRNTSLILLAIALSFQSLYAQVSKPSLVSIDDYEILIKKVKEHRATRLVSLTEFQKIAKEKNTIILDARSKEMYDRKHVKGAINLNFADFNQYALDDIMNQYEGKSTKILIYCNNNFEDPFAQGLMDPAFITKAAKPSPQMLATWEKRREEKVAIKQKELLLALNIPTYINLYGYGYENVYELAELVDVNNPIIEFEGTDVVPR